MRLAAPRGATFCLEKIGRRWWLVTPEGNGIFIRAVSKVDTADYGGSGGFQAYDGVFLQAADGTLSSNLEATAQSSHPRDVVWPGDEATLRRKGESLYLGSSRFRPNYTYFWLDRLGAGGRLQWYYSSTGGWQPINGTGRPHRGAKLADGGRGLYMSGLSPDLNYVALAEPDAGNLKRALERPAAGAEKAGAQDFDPARIKTFSDYRAMYDKLHRAGNATAQATAAADAFANTQTGNLGQELGVFSGNPTAVNYTFPDGHHTTADLKVKLFLDGSQLNSQLVSGTWNVATYDGTTYQGQDPGTAVSVTLNNAQVAADGTVTGSITFEVRIAGQVGPTTYTLSQAQLRADHKAFTGHLVNPAGNDVGILDLEM